MPDANPTATHERLRASLREVYGRPFLLAVDVVQAYAGMARQLEALGGEVGFVLAARVGTGPLPPESVPWHNLGLPPGENLMDAIHGADAALASAGEAVSALVDAVDPDRKMPALGAFYSAGAPVTGRPMWGARPATWQALEDKTVIDEVWDAASVPRAPVRVVPCSLDALTEAARALDEGHGTVWAGDAREGFHGGAARTRWVRDVEQARRAVADLGPHCDTARVMPFLEGLPCSIHGVVMPDGVAVFRPAEMLVLRGPDGFVYARAATLWDPPAAEREAMRGVARRVGQHLAEAFAYRGAYTVDGVMTAEGFRPTELNPRVGAAMGMLNPTRELGPQVPFTLLHFALVEGLEPSVSAAELEAAVLEQADRHRTGSFGFTVPRDGGARTTTETVPLRWAGERWERGEEDGAHATAVAGPGPTGDYINVRLAVDAPTRMGLVGRSLAPAVAAFVTWSDEHFGSTLGPLQPAPDLHRSDP